MGEISGKLVMPAVRVLSSVHARKRILRERGEFVMTALRRNPLMWMLLAVASASLIAAGCGSKDDSGGDGSKGKVKQEITVNWGTEPPSLDPGLATDTTSSNILLNIMDPLVRLDKDMKPVAALAKSWTISDDGLVYTFKLRDDGAWSNGDPVKASDFVYAWRRAVSPELGADYAYQFFGIKGACEYNVSGPMGKDEKPGDDAAACGGLKTDGKAESMGVIAVDDHTLEVTLEQPAPWFLRQLAHHSFLAVHPATVEKYGDQWTEAKNIVTNGPFLLDKWEHKSEINLVKNPNWRNADDVTLTRVNGRMIQEGTTAVQAYENDEIDVQISVPPQDIDRFKGTDDYAQYPALGTYYYGFNVKNIPDVNQRRAMTLAINHRVIIDQIAKADQLPPTGFTPKGMPGFDEINPDSPWLPEEGDMDQAKALMEKVDHPNTDISLFYNNSPGHKEIAVAVQDMWKQLGLNVKLKQQEFDPYLEFLGPPPNKEVDAYRLGWIGDFTEAYNFLELWRCDSGNNNTGFCDKDYDALIAKAASTQDDSARYELYKQAEQMLLGEDGQVPFAPIYWYTYTNLERPNINDTFELNLLDQVDLTKVRVEG
jgi:oligopeptide transport system substrate-binding protein